MTNSRTPRHAPQTPRVSPQAAPVEADEQATVGNAALQERLIGQPVDPEPSLLADDADPQLPAHHQRRIHGGPTERETDQRRAYGVDDEEATEFRRVGATGEAGYDAENNRTTGNVGLEHTTDALGHERTTGGEVGLNEDGQFTGALRTSRTDRDAIEEEDGRDSQTAGHEIGWTGDAVTAGRTAESVTHDEAGARTARSSSTTARLTGDHRGIGHEGHVERDTGDGNRARTTYEADVDVDEGRLTLGAGRELHTPNADGEHEEARGASGSATVDVDSRGRLEGVEAEGEVRYGPVTLSASGEWSVRATQPRAIRGPDGQVRSWAVDWSRTRAGSGGFGASGGRGGAEFEAGRRREERGSERFATRAEAQALADDIRSRVDDLAAGPSGAAEAEAMEEGESVTQTRTDSASLAGNANNGYLGVGVRGGVEESESRTVTRGRGHVDVTVDSSRMESLGIAGSSVGMSMGHSGEQRRARHRVVRFFIGTPEGQAAYEAFEAGRELPEGGWQLQEESTTDTDSDETTVGAFGMEGSDASEHRVTRSRNAAGQQTTEYRGENTRAASGFGSHARARNNMAATFGEGGERGYTVGTVASGSDADAVRGAIGSATNTSSEGSEGEAEGRYTVQTTVADAQMDLFVRRIRRGEAHLGSAPGGIGGVGTSGHELQERLLAVGAGDREAQARIVTDWISEEGPDGMAYFRQESGADATNDQTDVVLEGDRFLRGAEQRQGLERRIERYQAALARPGTDRGTIGRSVAGDLNGARARLRALEDDERYESLPTEIRAEEISRTTRWIEQLELLRSESERPGPAPAAANEEEGAETDSDAEEETPPARAPAARGAGVLAGMEDLQRRADRARERAEAANRLATRSRDVHGGSSTGVEDSARTLFGGERNMRNMWGLLGRDNASDYASADAAYAEGQERLRAGHQTRRSSEGLRSQLAHATEEEEVRHYARQVRLMLETEVATWTAAIGPLERAEATFQRIRRQHPDRPEMWTGYAD